MKRTNKTQRGKRKHRKRQKEGQCSKEFSFEILKNKALWQQYGKKFAFLARETTVNVLILELLFINFGISLDLVRVPAFHGSNLTRKGHSTRL